MTNRNQEARDEARELCERIAKVIGILSATGAIIILVIFIIESVR